MLFRFDLSDKIPPVVFSTATDFFLFALELVEVSIVIFLVQSTIVFFFVILIVHDAEEVDGYQARLIMMIAVPCSGLVRLQIFELINYYQFVFSQYTQSLTSPSVPILV